MQVGEGMPFYVWEEKWIPRLHSFLVIAVVKPHLALLCAFDLTCQESGDFPYEMIDNILPMIVKKNN